MKKFVSLKTTRFFLTATKKLTSKNNSTNPEDFGFKLSEALSVTTVFSFGPCEWCDLLLQVPLEVALALELVADATAPMKKDWKFSRQNCDASDPPWPSKTARIVSTPNICSNTYITFHKLRFACSSIDGKVKLAYTIKWILIIWIRCQIR